MNDKVGLVSFPPKQEAFAERPYSDQTAQMIDGEVRRGANMRTITHFCAPTCALAACF
jgi:ATP-dependent Zn protease